MHGNPQMANHWHLMNDYLQRDWHILSLFPPSLLLQFIFFFTEVFLLVVVLLSRLVDINLLLLVVVLFISLFK